MSTQQAQASEPSADAMQTAYAHIRSAGWPPLDEIMASARRYQLIRGAALRLARGERIERPLDAVQPTPRLAPDAMLPVTRHAPARAPWPWPPRRTFDPKRAAANDRDEEG